METTQQDWTLNTSLSAFFNACWLVWACRIGKLPPKMFSDEFWLRSELSPGEFIAVRPALHDIPPEVLLDNMRRLVAGACFIQFDEVARQKFGKRRWRDHPKPVVRDALAILYLVRCAFAHNMASPTWRIAQEHQNKIFKVPGLKIQLDTTNLDGTEGVISALGGWVRALKLVEYLHGVIAPTQAEKMRLNLPPDTIFAGEG